MFAFEPCTITIDNHLVRAVKLKCSTCSFEERVRSNSQNGPPSEERDLQHLKRKFESSGWGFDKKPKCPHCIREEEARAKAAAKALKVEAKLPKLEAEMFAPKPELKIVDTPPREMGREDKRIIFERLNDVYLSEKEGYAIGWTDSKVAADLGVPRIWVQNVRAEMFGDINTNAEIVLQMKQARELIEEGRRGLADMQARITAMENFEARLKHMEEVLRDIERNTR